MQAKENSHQKNVKYKKKKILKTKNIISEMKNSIDRLSSIMDTEEKGSLNFEILH